MVKQTIRHGASSNSQPIGLAFFLQSIKGCQGIESIFVKIQDVTPVPLSYRVYV